MRVGGFGILFLGSFVGWVAWFCCAFLFRVLGLGMLWVVFCEVWGWWFGGFSMGFDSVGFGGVGSGILLFCGFCLWFG